MASRASIFAGLAILTHLAASPAAAQTVPREPDPGRVRMRFGPVLLNPGIALTNAGVDSNVYFEDESEAPKEDFTMTMTGRSDLFLRMGRTWVIGNVQEDLIWYKQFDSERSVNGNYTATWLVPLNRLRLAAGGNWERARERPGFEIDARSQRYERAFGGAVELRAMSKTHFAVRGEQREVEFDKDAVFLGTNLNEELTRTVATLGFGLRHELTPLTSISLDMTRLQDRFRYSPDRNSDSTEVTAGISFDPFALINGSARIGYRDFKPLSGDVPGFQGLTTMVDLTYIVVESSRVNFRVMRDVQYSFEILQPYYLQTGFALAVGQQIYGPLDVEGRLGRQRLSYRFSGAAATPGRRDVVRNAGFGVGYRLGTELRVGFNVDRQERLSEVAGHNYDDWRYGFAVNYGL